MIRRRVLLAAVAVAVVVGAVLAWQVTREDDPVEAYCAEVREHQEAIGEELAAGGASSGLIDALPAFELLEAKAPDDIADEWRIVNSRIQALVDAVEQAGADPATYDRDDPPAGVSRAERRRIDQAATALDLPETNAAFAGVSQHARDVCHTPLYHAGAVLRPSSGPALPGTPASG